MPEVSIIIPTFNRAKIITKTLTAILNQTYTDFEVIIVSNGSTDNTEEVVKSFQDKRLIYIYQNGSGSPASPRNTGIKHATGKFIAFCDDDDIWLPGKLATQIDFLKSNPEYNICCTKMKRFNDHNVWINHDENTENSISSRQLLFRNFIPLSSLIVRSEIIKNGELFDEDKKISGAEDYELILRFSKKNKIFCIPEYLILYYSGNSRFSNAISKNLFKKNVLYLLRLYRVYKKIVHKGYFKYQDILFPFLCQCFTVTKIITYDFFATIKNK